LRQAAPDLSGLESPYVLKRVEEGERPAVMAITKMTIAGQALPLGRNGQKPLNV